MPVNYPFAALVGAEALCEALLWIAVDPTIGGVLATGTRGTAKSTAVRALADLLPPISVVAGDATNRAPGDRDVATSATIATIATPFVELPVGATEDRVIGTLDVRALLGGERRFEPGLLARANRGVLYVDEVNLLPDHLVDVILDAAATGRNVVERDGASLVHDARIVLVGTMNPEEGELRPQLLDRFGLCVSIAGDDDLARRVTIVERRLAFESDPDAFVASFAEATRALAQRIVAAREMLPHVDVPHACVRAASERARDANVEGMRADLTIVRAARAIAALAGRTTVSLADVERAAEPALAHRRREAPPASPPRAPQSSPPGASGDGATPGGNGATVAPAKAAANGGGATIDSDAPGDGHGRPQDGTSDATASSRDRTLGIGAPTMLELERRVSHARVATRAGRSAGRGGGHDDVATGAARVVRHRTPRYAALATVHAAARDAWRSVAANAGAVATLAIETQHLRYIERRGRMRALVVFVVDASGSMAAAERMRAAKGVVCGLLAQAYHRRDAVALVAFRGAEAEVLVPPTRSAIVAYRRLRTLATGGRTPLARGLAVARDLIVARTRRDPGARAHLVLVSDARANAPAGDAFAAALHQARALRDAGVRALCVDTERGTVRLGFAVRLARALDAHYRHLDDCSERALGATVREWMATA
ncbi:MAG: putative cobaltochelatase [Vulcanimicrobiaceae bacterium]